MENMEKPVRLKNGENIEIPVSLLRRELGVFLCGWGALVGFRCAQVMNLPILMALWWVLVFTAFSYNIFENRIRSIRAWLVVAALAGVCILFFYRYVQDSGQVFRSLDQHVVLFRHAGVMTNWVVLSTGLCFANLIGRILSQANIEAAPYARGLPVFLIVILILKNRVLGL
ncbi:hypothetical protein WDW86_16290 [Bdellovibrionota bacterium FG-2]